jgi:hypothetical protein
LKLNFDGLVKNLKSARAVIPANAGIQSFQMIMDSGYRIESGTGFAGVTDIGTFYDFVNFGLKQSLCIF